MANEVKFSDIFSYKKTQKDIAINLGFIGAGNMATAIRDGLIRSGVINTSQIYVSATSQNNLTSWKSLGANTTVNNSDVVLNCPVVILAVKPQFAAEAIRSAYSKFNLNNFKSVMLVSILAGVTCATLKKIVTDVLPDKFLIDKIHIARAMPNTPVLVGEGCTVCCFEEANGLCDSNMQLVYSEYKDTVKSIFSVAGYCQEVAEKLINPIGALSGSGPAYVYQIIEALSDGAVKLGVPRELSYKLAAQTLIGGAKMVLGTNKHPGQLKDEVCSPGGTTIAGISAMERNGVRYGLIQAVEAAYHRSEEIANLQSNP